MTDSSAVAVATDLLTAPSEAFAAIRQKSRVWLPLVSLIASYAAVSFAYTHSVDLPWFMEQQIEAQIARSGNEMSVDERERAIEAASAMSPATLGAISTAASTAFILVWVSLLSLYYAGVSFATGDGIKLKQWFALVCWCALPIVLGILASLVNILASDARFMLQEDINPLSFRNLLGLDTSQLATLERVLANLDVTVVWAIALIVLGYQSWTARSFAQSAGIVIGPLVVLVVLGSLLAAS